MVASLPDQPRTVREARHACWEEFSTRLLIIDIKTHFHGKGPSPSRHRHPPPTLHRPEAGPSDLNGTADRSRAGANVLSISARKGEWHREHCEMATSVHSSCFASSELPTKPLCPRMRERMSICCRLQW